MLAIFQTKGKWANHPPVCDDGKEDNQVIIF